MAKTLSRTAALKIARAEIYMAPMGGRYIVKEVDHKSDAIRTFGPYDFFRARSVVKDKRELYISHLMGA